MFCKHNRYPYDAHNQSGNSFQGPQSDSSYLIIHLRIAHEYPRVCRSLDTGTQGESDGFPYAPCVSVGHIIFIITYRDNIACGRQNTTIKIANIICFACAVAVGFR